MPSAAKNGRITALPIRSSGADPSSSVRLGTLPFTDTTQSDDAPVQSNTTQPAFRFVDLFAGIGGFRRAFESIDGKCVFTSEWNKFSKHTYCLNHTVNHPIKGDIRNVLSRKIPRHDVLLAGFPCQPFSLAGVSKKNSLRQAHGFRCRTQGTLFFEVARILSYHRPKAFLLENVKNLLSHDRGKTYRIIERTLTDDLGYQVSTRIIDSRPFVPQHRERVFIVGFRERNAFDFRRLRIPTVESG